MTKLSEKAKKLAQKPKPKPQKDRFSWTEGDLIVKKVRGGK